MTCSSTEEFTFFSAYNVIRAWYWLERHNAIRITIHGSRDDYLMIHCDAVLIVIYCKMSNGADKLFVYDLGSVNTSRYGDNSMDKLSQNNLIQTFCSSSFEYRKN